ncbi:MAG: DNA primase [Micromonosporaceae bacterium]|nr:DNA primase [Micromonosporaceae bacterium]
MRSETTVALWSEVRVDPVEIALPRGLGYTLRAYRMSDEVVLSDVTREEDDFAVLDRASDRPDSDEDDAFDEDESPEDEGLEEQQDDKSDDEKDDLSGEGEAGEAEDDEDGQDEDDDEELEEAAEAEEIPIFLGHGGKVYLFRTPESLVEFVRSDEEHDMSQIDGWSKLRERITTEDIVAEDADRYELDLIVDNLRGGQDAWDTQLLIRAGEVARDLGYALRINAVVSALAAGSPLDDLDEALRASESGGISAFFARRKLRKIGAQQAALGWRTIIGKISAAVDWRE